MVELMFVNVLSSENAFFKKLLLLFPHAVFTVLHMPLTAKELLTNHHEIHFVSTQLGTWSCNICFSAFLFHSYQ